MFTQVDGDLGSPPATLFSQYLYEVGLIKDNVWAVIILWASWQNKDL